MDKFNELPFPQKVLILVVTMAIVAGLFWYSMIMPLDDAMMARAGERTGMQNEVAKLRQTLAPDKDRDLDIEMVKLEEERNRFEEMLPKKEELVKFITSLSETAKNAGLQLQSFNKGPPAVQDYYLEIPIKMEVQGTFRELIGFMRTIAERDRRVVNIRELQITTGKMETDAILARMEKERSERFVSMDAQDQAQQQLSPLQRLMMRLKAEEEAISRGVPLEAKFVAYVFTYTGELAPPNAAAKIKTVERQLRRKRKEGLLIL
ncbi:MAG: type IV pilus assembly protein PilO [Myxococcota bacterium]|jgi:type IV pilus assembly protein PilO